MPFSVLDLTVVTVAAGAAFAFGWTARQRATSGQDAALKRSLYESKGAIPQLEASVRKGEQRIQTMQLEADALRSKLTSLESTLTQKDGEIARRDRDLRRLSTELQIAKEVDGADRGLHPQVQLIDDGSEAAPLAPPAAAPGADARLKKVEARYEAMKRAVLARDDRIVELEAALENAPGRSAESELEAIKLSAQEHAAQLASRDVAIKALETRVREESEQREQLETLARRRTETNRDIKDKLLKAEQQLPKLLETLKARSAAIAERDAALRDVRAELQHMTAERDARDRRLEELAQTVAARDEALKLRDARIQTQQASSHVLEQRVETLTAEVAARDQALQRSEAVVRERDSELAAQRARHAAMDAESAEHELAVETLKNAIRDREFRIDALTADVSRLSVALEAAQAAGTGSVAMNDDGGDDAESHALRERLDALSRDNDRLRTEKAAVERKLGDLEREPARVAEPVGARAPADDNQIKVLESQLATARLRCERTEDELLQMAREAKALRSRIAELETGGADEGAEDGAEDGLPDATPLLSRPAAQTAGTMPART